MQGAQIEAVWLKESAILVALMVQGLTGQVSWSQQF